MEQVYTRHHMTQVHHSGLIIGTIVGSSLVTLFAVLVIVIMSPQLILHPLNFTLVVSNNNIGSVNSKGDFGLGVSLIKNQTDVHQSSVGNALKAVSSR